MLKRPCRIRFAINDRSQPAERTDAMTSGSLAYSVSLLVTSSGIVPARSLPRILLHSMRKVHIIASPESDDENSRENKRTCSAFGLKEKTDFGLVLMSASEKILSVSLFLRVSVIPLPLPLVHIHTVLALKRA